MTSRPFSITLHFVVYKNLPSYTVNLIYCLVHVLFLHRLVIRNFYVLWLDTLDTVYHIRKLMANLITIVCRTNLTLIKETMKRTNAVDKRFATFRIDRCLKEL